MERTQQQEHVTIEEPTAGYFILRDFPRYSQLIEGAGHLVAPDAVHIPPTISDATLLSLIERRKQSTVTNTTPKTKRKSTTKAVTDSKKGGKA